MGYYGGSEMALWKVAQQFTLADNFFMGAIGGSFLNHRYHRRSLEPLPGLIGRDLALTRNGSHPMGDLTGALDFSAKS